MSFHEPYVASLWTLVTFAVIGAAWLVFAVRTAGSRAFAAFLAFVALYSTANALSLTAIADGRYGDSLFPSWWDWFNGLMLAVLPILFLGFFPERRGWVPTTTRGWIVSGAVVVVFAATTWFARVGSPLWLPVRILETTVLPVVAVVLVLSATRRRDVVVQRAVLAVALALFLFALPEWINSLMQGWEDRVPGMAEHHEMWMVRMVGGGILVLSAIVAAASSWVGAVRSASRSPHFWLFPVVLVGTGFGVKAVVGSAEPFPVLAVFTASDVAFVLLSVWALTAHGRYSRPASDQQRRFEPALAAAPAQASNATGAASEDERGDPRRFHPRLGLDDRDP